MPHLEKISIYSNKFFHNFHLSESNFTCPGLRASGLAGRLNIQNIKYATCDKILFSLFKQQVYKDFF